MPHAAPPSGAPNWARGKPVAVKEAEGKVCLGGQYLILSQEKSPKSSSLRDICNFVWNFSFKNPLISLKLRFIDIWWQFYH